MLQSGPDAGSKMSVTDCSMLKSHEEEIYRYCHLPFLSPQDRQPSVIRTDEALIVS